MVGGIIHGDYKHVWIYRQSIYRASRRRSNLVFVLFIRLQYPPSNSYYFCFVLLLYSRSCCGLKFFVQPALYTPSVFLEHVRLPIVERVAVVRWTIGNPTRRDTLPLSKHTLYTVEWKRRVSLIRVPVCPVTNYVANTISSTFNRCVLWYTLRYKLVIIDCNS